MLLTIKNVIEELNESSVRYVHWKSNEHLKEALNGETDLDLLIHVDDYHKLLDIINRYRFKKYDTQKHFKYASVDDYIGFDQDTGKLIHLHIHHQLILGKKFIKDLRLPIEDYIFKTYLIDNKSKINIINPDLEIIILLMRFVIKYEGLVFKPTYLNNEYIKEYNWLFQRINIDEVQYHSTILFGKEFGVIIKDLITNINDSKTLKLFRKKIRQISNVYRKDHLIVTTTKYLYAKGVVIFKNIFIKRMKRPLPYKRVNPNSGAIIVFMGVDGAGKSTLVNFTKKWLSRKMDVYSVYFGSGDGPSSIIRYPFNLVKKSMIRVKRKTNKIRYKKMKSNKQMDNTKKNWNLSYRILRAFWAILLAYEKKRKFEKTWKARSNGMVVISDRYPQSEVYDYNDGPLLTEWLNSKNKIKYKIGEWEYSIYKMGEIYKPDLIIKLKINKKVAAERKPETPSQMITKKIEAVNKITIHPESKIISIFTDESLDKTKQTIRNTVKEYL